MSYTDHQEIKGKTIREVFAMTGFPVPDKYDLRWNSRSGWIIRGWKGEVAPDAIFCASPKGAQRVISRGWVVPQCSIPLDFDEPMVHLAAPCNVFDTLPQAVKDAVSEGSAA